MPYSPRRSVPAKNARAAVFSPDFHYAAVLFRDSSEEHGLKWTLWDLDTGQAVFSFPAPSKGLLDFDFGVAISRDNRFLVQLCHGKPTFYKLPSGEIWTAPGVTDYPHDPDKGVVSRLARDLEGRLLVVVEDESKEGSIWELLSAKQIGQLPPSNAFGMWFLPGGYLLRSKLTRRIELRELPSGQLGRDLESNENIVHCELEFHCVAHTPDCDTVVRVFDETIEVWNTRSGKRREVDVAPRQALFFQQAVTISPDGRHVVFLGRHSREDDPAWLDWLLRFVGHHRHQGSEAVLYDLATNTETASFRVTVNKEFLDSTQPMAEFSLDGKSLAVPDLETLDIYDFPLHRPWLKIAGCAFAASASAWVLACLLGRCFGIARKRRAGCSPLINSNPPLPPEVGVPQNAFQARGIFASSRLSKIL
jgi:hypothetical protein